ncbi:MAG TPA: ABC transporter permease [Fimbriimonadaceae bacterium]|jgi:rhamnose transport system permease protein
MKWRALVPAVLLVIATFIGSRLSPKFLDFHFLLDRSTLVMETGLIALGMTFVMICGEIDLSVASNMVLTGCVTAKLLEKGWGIPAGVAFACLMGTGLGFLNGLLTAKLKLPSFLVTLGTMAAYRGAAQAMMGPDSVKLPKGFVNLDESYVLGIPWPVMIFLVIAVITAIVLHQTVFGRWAFSTGTNESASRYSGIPTDRVKILVFALTGLMCGIGSCMLTSRLGVARYDLANGAELDAITVVAVGGTSIFGGSGTMLGTILSLFLIDIMRSAMGVANMKAEYQLTAIGSLLILSVLAMNLGGKIRLSKRSSAGAT